VDFIGIFASVGVVDLIVWAWVACLIALVSTDFSVAESLV